ncbi:MAG: hypothetical protein NVS2B14_07640 [Chamaesiphon sp.]
MEEQRPAYLNERPKEDWDKTPASIKNLVEDMAQQIKKLEQQVAELVVVHQQLLEKINSTSKNSSSSPSQDRPNLAKKPRKAKSGKKRGGQLGHDGHSRNLYPIEACSSVIDHHPQECGCCGEKLVGEDDNPYRHQIVEIPPISPIVIEHRLHQLVCKQCGTKSRATLPVDVNHSGYGVRVVAIVALLSGLYRLSHRMVQSGMQDLFAISLSLGSVNQLREEASNAVASAVEGRKNKHL